MTNNGHQQAAERLQAEVLEPLRQRFVGRDEVVHLIALAAVAREHLFLLGPPGTAKSALIRHFGEAVRGRYYEYMLTRFSEPNEIFGPIDIAQLREGRVVTVTGGMLPQAEFAFLDELFNANSAILNNLLTVLNERVYRRGLETHRLPLVSLYSASNHVPDDDALRALFDRFLLRCRVRNLPLNSMPTLLQAGWSLETAAPLHSSLDTEGLAQMSAGIAHIDLTGIMDTYVEMIGKIRDLGIALSDRRAVKILKLLAASAILSGRQKALVSDLWVLRYVWDHEEQIEPLAGLVNGVLDQHKDEANRHPLASVPTIPTAEEIASQLEKLELQSQQQHISLATLARLKEQLGSLTDQASWLKDPKSREYLLERARKCLEKLH